MFSQDDLKALLEILEEEKGRTLPEKELLRDIDEELDRPEEEIRSEFIRAGINCLQRAEGPVIPTFNDAQIGQKLRKIKEAARVGARFERHRRVFCFYKTALAACIALLVLICVNFVVVAQTGKCVFSGIVGNRFCCSDGFGGQDSNVLKSETKSALSFESRKVKANDESR